MIVSASRPRLGFNGKSPAGRRTRALAAIALCACVAACGQGEPEAQATEGQRRRTPSGLPVPRYVSLKFDEVNARGGPGDDYRLLWTYRVRGLPLQVIAETTDWRRVCDPEGAVAWVHQRTVDTRRTVMRTSTQALPIRRRPAADASLAATLLGRSVAALGECRDGWCEVAVGGAEGWIPQGEVWGVGEGARCQTPAPVVGR